MELITRGLFAFQEAYFAWAQRLGHKDYTGILDGKEKFVGYREEKKLVAGIQTLNLMIITDFTVCVWVCAGVCLYVCISVCVHL